MIHFRQLLHLFFILLIKMLTQRNTPRRPPRNARLLCYFGSFCAIFLLIFVTSESYKRLTIAPYFILFSRANHNEKSSYLKYTHLQPLKEMFANLTGQQRDRKLNKSDCMVAVSEFSDLKELEEKRNVLLLVIVSSAPSRQLRRAIIRQTWWGKCHGKVSITS